MDVSERLRQVLPDAPLIAYRRQKTLRDLLVRAELKDTIEDNNPNRNSPCNYKHCKTCQHINCIKNHITTQFHKVQTSATCKTSNLVYLIECSRCRKQYVGETGNPTHIYTSMATGMTLKQIEWRNQWPTSQGTRGAQLRERRESYWIHTLGTMAPAGMNLEGYPDN